MPGKQIYIVSGNVGKTGDFERILGHRSDVNYFPYRGPEIQDEPQKIVEDKAVHAWNDVTSTKKDCWMVVVEDTSLYIEGLGVTGPYIKKWVEEVGVKGIYEKARRLNEGVIRARVESWICAYNGKRFITRKGETLGQIVAPRGESGFGWDSIFQPYVNPLVTPSRSDSRAYDSIACGSIEGKRARSFIEILTDPFSNNLTYAEMTPEMKNAFSFRRLAIEKIRPHLRNWNVDAVVGLEWGDEAKGKVVCHLLNTGDYTHGVRWQGGPNAGHTIYTLHEGKRTKVVTHMVPSTVLSELTSVIGDACKIDPIKLDKELDDLEVYVKNVRELVKISGNCGLISQEHIEEDRANDTVGTTHSGIGPCTRDYYARKCMRVIDVAKMAPDGKFCGCEVIPDTVAYWMQFGHLNIMAEGAQGHELSITGPNYPFVTSTSCDVGFLNSCGLNPHCIGTAYGVAKIYTTYVGSMPFGDPDDPVLKEIQEVGQEFGSTTGRRRKVDWLDLNRLRKACIAQGVNCLVISKCDVLEAVDHYRLYENGKLEVFPCLDAMTQRIEEFLDGIVETIIFSCSPDHI